MITIRIKNSATGKLLIEEDYLSDLTPADVRNAIQELLNENPRQTAEIKPDVAEISDDVQDSKMGLGPITIRI